MAVDNLPDDWHVFDDAEQLAQQVTLEILAEAKKAIEDRGAFHFITAGGTTPNRCYELLSKAKAYWSKWHIYMGDERVLHFNDSERNSQALLKHWLNNNDIPAKNIHFINTEAGAEKSAKHYACLFDSVAEFDLCLLGMGEDGHTASLFPGNAALDDLRSAVPVYDAPKAPGERVSIGLTTLKNAAECIVIATGENKREALVKLKQGVELPVGLVGPDTWLGGEAAAS